MNLIAINTSSPYNVYVGHGLLSSLPTCLSTCTKASKVAIISDSNVWPIHGHTLTEAFESYDQHDVFTYIIPAGEQSKNGTMFLAILEFLAENKFTRTDCIIAFGGGVVGDLAGFAASAYLRGIDYVQVPTSLLACVDSSVGGKTAIDLQGGKNLAGAFYQPKMVLCDIDILATLPSDIFTDGCAEVIKYGILYDSELFDHLEKYGDRFDRKLVITRCIELKRNVVACDEFDRGERQKLNLGHTLGHGVESNSKYKISHGKAVAIGISMITRASCRIGLCDSCTADRIIAILQKFSLPVYTDYSAEAIFNAALSDKKRSANSVNLIIPERIGCCKIVPTQINTLLDLIRMGY